MRLNRGSFLSALAGLIAGALLIGALPGLATNGDYLVLGEKNTARRVTKVSTKNGFVFRSVRVGSPAIALEVVPGTPPMEVDSAVKVTNLNADLLDGQEAAAFALSGHTHAGAAFYAKEIQIGPAADPGFPTGPDTDTREIILFEPGDFEALCDAGDAAMSIRLRVFYQNGAYCCDVPPEGPAPWDSLVLDEWWTSDLNVILQPVTDLDGTPIGFTNLRNVYSSFSRNWGWGDISVTITTSYFDLICADLTP